MELPECYRRKAAVLSVAFTYPSQRWCLHPPHGIPAVSGGDADAGMGIQSAARAMGLDFIEIGREEYDFAIPVRFLDFPPVQHFLAVLKSREFAERVEKLGGYGLARTGEILYL